jgi:hypothetical protein
VTEEKKPTQVVTVQKSTSKKDEEEDIDAY